MATIRRDSAFRPTSGSDLRRLLAALLCCTAPLALTAQDLPTGGQVAAGSVKIGTPVAGGMTVTQGSDTAVVNWNTFDVGAGKTLRFEQPSTSSAILNRVTGTTDTTISGRLTANGQVHIVNPNGIFIGPNGLVQAGGGFVASTLDITDDDFRDGTLTYRGSGQSGRVDNAGTVQVGRGGYAALLGGHVSNAGTITVPMGRIGFASGERVTLNLSGDGFLQVAVPTDAKGAEGKALIENSGRVSAAGGQIEMKAATARNAVRHAINLSGVAEASSVSVRGGTITLGGGAGGQVTVSGRVATRAVAPRHSHAVTATLRPTARPVTGGTITVTGQQIALQGATFDAGGTDGGGSIRIGGDFAGAGALPRASRLTADAGTTIRADALHRGDGGRIVLWSDLLTEARPTLSARGGAAGGDGGFVEVSSRQTLRYDGLTDTRAPRGRTGLLLLDPDDITVNPGAGFNNEAMIESNLLTSDVRLDTSNTSGEGVGNVTVNANLDWGTVRNLDIYADNNIRLNGAINGPNGGLILNAANQITTGTNGRVNVGSFMLGQGDWRQVGVLPAFAARDFNIGSGSFLRATGGNGTTVPYRIVDVYGLQGIGSSATLLASNFRLGQNIDARSTRTWLAGESLPTGFRPIGELERSFTGTFDGGLHTISGLFSDQTLSEGGARDAGIFGHVGSTGTVSQLFVSGLDIYGGNAGGIAATNEGLIFAVHVDGAVGGSGSAVGGLVGSNFGTLRDSRSAAAVSGGASFSGESRIRAGGAVGLNEGTMARVHATGNVSATDGGSMSFGLEAGGLVGVNRGIIVDSYARGDVTAISTGGAGNGVTAGGFVGLMDETSVIARSYSTGRIITSITGSPEVNIGGFAGDNFGPGPIASFWDRTSSGRATSAAGVGLTTAQFQNTAGFVSLAGAQGWVFTGSGAAWAPGAAGRYPANYTTSPVVYVVPTALNVVYGQTGSVVAPGTITGGPSSYVFDDPTDTDFARSAILGNLIFGNTNVGTTTYRLGVSRIAWPGGPDFTVIATPATARITPRPLTITADDVVRTYGQGRALGLADVTVAAAAGGTGLVPGDRVTGIIVRSAGTRANAAVAGSPYVIRASNATGDGLENYDITYVDGALTVNRADLQVIALDQINVAGQSFVFDGTEYQVIGLVVAADRVDQVRLSSDGASDAAAVGSYGIDIADARGNGLENYNVTFVNGTMTVVPATGPAPVPVPSFRLPNPRDTVRTEITLGSLTESTVTAGGTLGAAGGAAATLVRTRSIADRLTDAASTCGGSDADVTRYLACLSDALNAFAEELDAIAADLPPGLENVAQIVQDARRGLDAANLRAQSRLAGATTDAERRTIRDDAVRQAQGALNTAATEIRKAISLVRVEDPELAGIQRETIIAVADAVDSVSIEMSRVIGL